jgi:hypothetical protein
MRISECWRIGGGIVGSGKIIRLGKGFLLEIEYVSV